MARTKEFDQHLILDRAMQLFWQKGYNATSAQDLVDHLGISRSSLYDTFGDKHSLFINALKEYRRQRIDDVIAESKTTIDAEQYIRSLFEFVKTEALDDDRSKGCFMINSAVEMAPSDLDVATIVNAIMKDFEAAVCHVLKKGQDQGVFTTNYSARSLSRFVFNSLNGLRVTVKFDASSKSVEDIVEVCLYTLRK